MEVEEEVKVAAVSGVRCSGVRFIGTGSWPVFFQYLLNTDRRGVPEVLVLPIVEWDEIESFSSVVEQSKEVIEISVGCCGCGSCWLSGFLVGALSC